MLAPPRNVLSLAAVLLAATLGAERDLVAQARPGGPQGPARTGPTTITATAVISGRVVAATGGPLRGAEVRVRDANGRDSRLITTDNAGRFEVRDLTPGQWTVKASKAGYITQAFGQRHPLEQPETVTLENGQRFVADLVLMRGGAIGGRVVDEYGDPVFGARVQVLRSKMVRGLRQLATAGTPDDTDDRGAFRIFGLPPGDYYVAVGLRLLEDNSSRRMANVATYYPGTQNIGQAQRITLGAGDDQSGIVIATGTGATGVSVSGRVLTAAGAPGRGAMMSLLNADDFGADAARRGIIFDADQTGRFTAENVPPGNYVVDVQVPTGNGPGAAEHALLPLGVGSENVSDVLVVTRQPLRITGVVVTDDDARGPIPAELPFSITLENVDGSRSSSFEGAMAPLRPTGTGRPTSQTITFIALGRVTLNVTDLPEGWMVKAIELNGNDVSDSVIDLNAYGATASVRIVLTNRSAEVSGAITLRGEPTQASVVVFPDDPGRWTYPSRYVRAIRSDREGRFRIASLPPARYRAVALDVLEQDEFQDPEFLQRIEAFATEFSLSEDEKETIALTPIAR